MLVRLNRELGADFDPEAFAHRAVWNRFRSRIEMHLGNQMPQTVQIPALDMRAGILGRRDHPHREQLQVPARPGGSACCTEVGLQPEATWTDEKGWFAVCLARAE